MTRYTITDTAAGHLIADRLDKYEAADALRAEFAGAPTSVRETVEELAVDLENGNDWHLEATAFLALDIDDEIA